ncbi:hypothetical protein EDB81DRAFT_814126 [Dactylonectria macrodidyma]|uniref:Integral membrane protein n=1 Tax=Dactylonectria macrodidyma TaxID=307937 RepID=A0A9P9DLW7_9HYPO|nr:hypothetical protein EDB81DRAFT_814126 [Dactylonectria macrodidyma]
MLANLRFAARRVFTQTLAIKAVTCLALLLCMAWFGRLHFYRDPGSVFFDKDRAYETDYSAHRRVESQQFIDAYVNGTKSYINGTSQFVNNESGPNKTLCVALSSVKRQTQYLQTTIGTLLHGLTARERADLHVSVLIAETDPTRHPSWHEGWIRRAVDDFYTYQVNATKKAHLQKLEEAGEYSEKGMFDYAYALQRCYDTGAPYVGMFEDDIIMARGWLVRTLLGLQHISDLEDDDKSWLFMRLFNQERSTGWASHDIGGNHEHWIIVGVGIGITASVLLARRRWLLARQYVDIETLLVTVVILVPGLVILFYQSGKASLLPPSPGVFNEPFGCCSQAMVFPRAQVPLMLETMRAKRKGQVDLLLDEIAIRNNLEQYALYPVQAQHIGIESARKTAKTEAQAIWSMAFEDLDPGRLEREQLEMVQKYYGWEE